VTGVRPPNRFPVPKPTAGRTTGFGGRE
jgi:hypothetical protein